MQLPGKYYSDLNTDDLYRTYICDEGPERFKGDIALVGSDDAL